MKKATLEAIKGSIHKWEKICDGKDRDKGVTNCPLCLRFFKNGPARCRRLTGEKCPVRTRTWLFGCNGSPYEQWRQQTRYDGGGRASTPKLKELAQAEVDFLESLLPQQSGE